MAKVLSSWRKKGRTAPTTLYPSASVDYDSPTQKYIDNGQTPESIIKKTSLWSKRLKAATRFIINPLAYAARLAFNTHTQYNTHLTYDGIVVGEPHSTAKKPQAWSKA